MLPVKQNLITNDDEHGQTALPNFDIRDVDHLPVLAQIWDELQLTEVVDAMVPVDEQVALSPGRALKALVLNVTGGRDPLYRVRSWAERVPLELFLGAGVEADQLNDTSLGRQLDRLFEAGPESVFNAACLRVIERERVSLARLQADTTSRLVFGAYKHEEEDAISITRGHSKDQRPDLKQVMYGVTTSHDGIPVSGQLLSGNTSDKTWHGAMLERVRKHVVVERERPVHYVGDSALVTEANLEIAAREGIVLTSRLPRTYSLADSIVLSVLYEPIPMQALGSFSPEKGATRYEGCLVENCTLLGHKVKLGVYRPTPANERTRGAVFARRKKQLQSAERAAKKLMSTTFACEADARAALDAFERDFTSTSQIDQLFSIATRVEAVEVPVKRGRGRPAKDAAPATTTEFQATVELSPHDKNTEAAIARESCFVLVHTGQAPISAAELLRAYKGQSVVETRFPFLKDPSWADVFFLKTPHRVEALGYILLLSLLLWSVWERRVRLNAKASKEQPLKDTTGMKKPNPTAMVCGHILRGLKAVRVQQGSSWSSWQLAGRLQPEQERVIRFSGPPPMPLPVGENHRLPA